MFKRLREWWAGKVIRPDNDPNSGVVFFPYIQRPFLARHYEALTKFVGANWQFLIGTAIGIVGLVLAYSALK